MKHYTCWKRGLDLIIATIFLVATLPLWVVIACALWLLQGPYIFFSQQRAGHHGKPFTMLKFRTMRDGDPPRLPDRPVAKDPADPRVTPIGRMLRRFKLDELPQFLNVLRGEMSLVGPRPLPIDDLQQSGWLKHVDDRERARRLDWYERRHQVLPGVTGLWQISANPEEDFDNWMICDLAYVARCSLPLDGVILCKTARAILRGRDATIIPTPSPANSTRE